MELITKETINEIQFTKQSIKQAYNSAIEAIDNGLIDEVELQVFAKYFSELGKVLASKDLKDKAFDTLKGDKSYTFKGVKVEPAQVGTKYDFSNSDAYNYITGSIKLAVNDLQEQLEEVKRIAKNVSKPTKYAFIDTDSGEIKELEIQPAIKTSTDSVKVTFPKE